MGTITLRYIKEDVLSWATDKQDNMQTQTGFLVEAVLNIYMLVASVLAPFRTGHLSESHVVSWFGLSGALINTAEYYIFVIMGTRPHEIRPIDPAGALWWPSVAVAGIVLDHPVKLVHHPGTRANDYMSEVIPSADTGVDDEIGKFLDWMVS